MPSSDDELFGGYEGSGEIDEFLEPKNSHNFDIRDPFTPPRVQRPADYSTPAQPQRRMHTRLPILHTRPSNILQEPPPQVPASPTPPTPVVCQELSSPEVGDSEDQGNVPIAHEDQRNSPVILRSPYVSSNTPQGASSPRVDSDIDDGSSTGSQHPDETSATVAPSIESPKVKYKESQASPATLDRGGSEVFSDDLYDVSPQRSNRDIPQQLGRQQPEKIIVDSDSDDDCVLVEVREIRSGEKRMFSKESRRPRVKDESTPESPTWLSTLSNDDRQPSPTEQEMLAAQEAMIPPAHSSGAGPTRPLNESRKRRRESFASSEGQLEMDTAMQGNEDDNNWMHAQGDDGDDSQEEYENLLILQNALNKEMNRKGNLSLDERAELIRLNNTLARMDRLKAAKAKGFDDEEDDNETLFIPETHRRSPSVVDNGEGPSSRRDNGFENFDDDAGLASMLQEQFDLGIEDLPSNKHKPKKTRRAPAKNAREFHVREEERKIEKERAKAQEKRATGGKNRRAEKVKAGRKGKGKEDNKSRKGFFKVDRGINETRFMLPRGGQQDEIGQLILDDLMNCDPVGDRLQDPIFNVGPEPEIDGTTRTKTSQLQQLFANIPEGSSKTKGKSDKAKLLQASRSFGYAQVKAVNGKWLVKGMKSTLYHHQLLGAQWMVSRELSSEPPHGGLLADSMGLGKTVQTLACMVGNPPTKEDRQRGVTATLIVVPSSVIGQWLEEIKLHVDCNKVFRKVMQYKASMRIPPSVLRDLDIVVTSYTEVMKQFPFPDRKGREDIARFGYKRWWKNAHDGLGDLHQINWRRVVLDEAHAIKNNSARTSLACQNLKSVYRWCLTGTPLLNRIEELFPYLRFLKANYSMDWRTFQQYFCDPEADDCNNRIATLLSYAMMRRTMKTTILNRPIITLPQPHPVMQQINFSREERIIYRITENRFRANLNVFLANGTAQRAYGVFFVQLLRLRQCTSHPFMLERTMKESWTTEDVELLRGELKKQGIRRIPFYEQCKLWVSQSEEERAAARARDERGAEAIPFGLSEFGDSFIFDKALDSLNDEELYTRITCHICSDVPNQPIITTCKHIFCRSCLNDHLHSQMHLSDGDDTYNVCPKCDIIFSSAEPYSDLEIPDDDNMDSGPNHNQESESSSRDSNKRQKSSNDGSRRPRGIKSKGMDALNFEPFTKDSTWVTKSDYDPDFPLIPSAKTTALKALLLKGFEEAPDDKVVIYVQFRTLARIIGRMCAAEGWGFLYLTGDASFEHRSKAIREFRNKDKIQILIAGLKCGGLGLNFPFANRCISLDLWWNHAVEQQAFGRIFRIGQNKETWMTRLVVRNSVDMRLLGMQDWKLRACEKAIDNNGQSGASGSGGATLNLSQLARLFGFLKTDEDDNVVRIEPDYEDDGDGEGIDGSRASQGQAGQV